jgi:hypothetical protein
MTKAKSRLRLPTAPSSAKPNTEVTSKSRRRYTLLLILGLINWAGLAFILLTISPVTIQHLVVPHLYLPVLSLFGLGCFFSLAFILLHTRRAFILSLMLTTFLFFQLQQFNFTWQLVSAILIFFGILELSLTLIRSGQTTAKASSPKHADIKPQADEPKRD